MYKNFSLRQPRDWWNTLALSGAAVIVVVGMIGSSACSFRSHRAVSASTPRTPDSANSAGASVPKSVFDAGEYGENIYDYAKVNDWQRAGDKLAALKDAVRKVRADVKNQSATVDRLDAEAAALDGAVTAKDRQAAMRTANQVTRDVAEMTTAYKLSVPVEVSKLDYCGRELEIWAEAKDTNKLQATVREMRRTWNALRPSVESIRGAEAKKFDGLVVQVEAAKAPADYSRLAKVVLDEVDNLEKVFH